jgi:3-oxoadipate enol-lactonase
VGQCGVPRTGSVRPHNHAAVRCAGVGRGAPGRVRELLALRLSAPTPAAAWRAQFAACAAFLRAGLPAGVLPQRSTVVHGTADRVVPYGNAAHLAERSNGAPVVTLQDAGHLCWIERANVVNDLITPNGHGGMT